MLCFYRRHLWLRLVMYILACLAVIECCLIAAVALTARHMDAPQPESVIIVLGCGIDENDGTPRATLAFRLDRAKELYDAGYAPYIIVSGGQGTDEPVSEAQSMYTYLAAHGVPGDAIIMEDTSRNTQENMRFSKEIMDAHGFDSALVITSDYHLWRAMQLAGRAGITGSCAGSRNSDNAFYTFKNLAQETLSWIKFMLNQ